MGQYLCGFELVDNRELEIKGQGVPAFQILSCEALSRILKLSIVSNYLSTKWELQKKHLNNILRHVNNNMVPIVCIIIFAIINIIILIYY